MQQLDSSADCLSNLELDEWFAGELDAATRTRFDRHLADCAKCQSRRSQFEHEAAQFYAEAPRFNRPPGHARGDAPRAAIPAGLARPSARPRTWGLTALAALAASVALIAWPHAPYPATPTRTRTKGTSHLGFFVKRGELVRRGLNGEQVYPGDFLRFVYSATERLHLGVFNVDPRTTSIYFPSATEAAPITAGSDVALDFSVELDAQLGVERVIAVFCRETFALEPVRAALAVSAPLPAAVAECERAQILLQKVPPP